MISTTTLQPPTNGLYIVMSVYVTTVVEIMVLIIAKNSMTKLTLHRTRFKRRGIFNQAMVTVVEDVLVCGNYEPNKLGMANTARLGNSGAHCFDEVWMAYCGKCNTWSAFPMLTLLLHNCFS